MIGPEETGEPGHSKRDTGRERAASVIAEFADAARSAAESLLEEQKQQIADKVSGIAEALHCAAQSLDRSQNRSIAGYVDQAADQIENITRTLRQRRWNEIIADTEDFARRQPTLFVLGAAAAGFLLGRLLWASADERRNRSGATRASSQGETTPVATAAVSSSCGTGAGEMAGHAAGSSGVLETR
jgi:ElaB/YqjD/DUF883 family membrane-anchored ribosome-binding protein